MLYWLMMRASFESSYSGVTHPIKKRTRRHGTNVQTQRILKIWLVDSEICEWRFVVAHHANLITS